VSTRLTQAAMNYDVFPMRIITVNCCGIRSAATKGLFKWLAKQNADFICLQETKAHFHQLADHDIDIPGYKSYFNDAERKGYAGVAIYTRHEPARVVKGFGVPEFDGEGRYLEVQVGDLSVGRQMKSAFCFASHLNKPLVAAERIPQQLTVMMRMGNTS
jgi:exonuclease III